MWNYLNRIFGKNPDNNVISDDHFMGASDDVILYLAEQGIKACERQELAITVVRDRVHKFISILMVGIGGSLMLFINNLDGSAASSQYYFLLILVFGWSGCAIFSAFKCLFAKERDGIYGSPDRLYKDWASVYGNEMTNFEILKRLRLVDYSNAARKLHEIAASMSRSINAAMVFAVITPILCAVLFVVNYFFFLIPGGT